MYDIQALKRAGVSSGAYKAIFTKKEADLPAGVRRLLRSNADLIKEGVNQCLSDHRGYHAIDLAFETPQEATAIPLMRDILSRKLNAEKTLQAVRQWGLNEQDLFTYVKLPNGQTQQVLNPPVFVKFVVPLVKAYTTIRLAKIYGERDRSPLFRYNPLKETEVNRVACELWTDIVQTQSTWLGYSATLREACLQALKYGTAIAFPREEWFVEEQMIGDKVKIQREGIRHIIPHPTQMFYDLNYSLASLNSDSGCEYAGHWYICRAGDVLDNRLYWNRKTIPYGTDWTTVSNAGQYFKEVFPCTMEFPRCVGLGRPRENRAAYYSGSDRDRALFLCEFFRKIVPRTWGLANYNYPVWHRFTFVSDDTPIWVEPCAYRPCWWMGYDYDPNTARQSSFSLECLQFENAIGNIIAQMILTAKQNLAKLSFYDTNVVNKDVVEKLSSMGDARYTDWPLVPYDSIAMQRSGLTVEKAFTTIDFPYRNIQELVMTMNTILNIMERVLQISAQEAGTVAAHYQSAKEVGVVMASTSQRLAYTANFVDEGIDAWKLQLHDGAVAYLDPQFVGEINRDTPNLDAVLTGLGFKKLGESRGKVLVQGQVSKIRLEGFARSNEGPVEPNDPAMAAVIMQVVGVVAANPLLSQAVGSKRIVALLQQAAILGGAAKDFRLPIDPAADQAAQQQQQLPQMLKQIQQQMIQYVTEQVAKPAAEAVAKQQAEIQQLQEAIKSISAILGQAAPPPPGPPPEAAPAGPPPPAAPPVGVMSAAPPPGPPV